MVSKVGSWDFERGKGKGGGGGGGGGGGVCVGNLPTWKVYNL